MNRTWKDAACEVAWNKMNKNGERCRSISIIQFLKGDKQCLYEEYMFTANFDDFRKEFMEWLDENEVRK